MRGQGRETKREKREKERDGQRRKTERYTEVKQVGKSRRERDR